MKILIVGEKLNALLFAKYLKLQDCNQDIYITTNISFKDKYYTPIGIMENEIDSIVDFVKYNQIDLTIVFSEIAIINGISDIFGKEGFPIVAPFSEAARITFFNSIAKKVMYKLKINTSRFGIFDRENIASDFIRRVKYPILIKNDFVLSERKESIQKSYRRAKLELQKIFASENEKIVIESYIDENPVYVYFLTDGYNALPLVSIERAEEDNYIQIITPSQKITNKYMHNILKSAIFPVLDDIAKYAGNYSGIIGVKIKIKENNLYVLEYYNGFQSYDLQAFLSISDEDLLSICLMAANKELVNLGFIKTKNMFSYTLAISKDYIEKEANDEDYFITEDNNNIIITKTAATMNFAKNEVLDYLEIVCKEEIYRKIKEDLKEKLRI